MAAHIQRYLLLAAMVLLLTLAVGAPLGSDRSVHADGDDEPDAPILVPSSGRVDLSADVGLNVETSRAGVVGGAVVAASGPVGFAPVGTEQDALAEYLARFFTETPFGLADTAAVEDRRIQNLGVAGAEDTVFDR